MKAHEALFEQQGGSFIIVKKWVANSEYHFYAPRKFVGLRSEMEQVVAEYKKAGNDWRILSKRLGLGAEDLSDIQIYLIRIKLGDPRFSYKMPNGKEIGANGEWIAGGFTKGGIREAALEGSEVIRTDGTVETILKQFENWEQLQ